MKKNILRTTALTILAVASLLFTSCFDPIYHTVLTDVKPEKPTVSGDITSIARYTVGNGDNAKEYLVLSADGGLRYKRADNTQHGSWKTYSKLGFSPIHSDALDQSSHGKKILKVVSDQTHLYLATVEFTGVSPNTPTNPKLYAVKITDWNKDPEEIKEIVPERPLKMLRVSIGENRNPIWAGFNIFSTNDEEQNKRKAYLRVGDLRLSDKDENKAYKTPEYYELKNGIATTPGKKVASAAKNEIDPVVSGINSVVNTNDGTPLFFNTSVAASYYNNSKQYVYIGSGNTLYYRQGVFSNNDNDFTKSVDLGAPISSIAPCSDSLVVGLGDTRGNPGGIRKVTYKQGNCEPYKVERMSSNANIQIPDSYVVPVVLNATPDKAESASNIYAAVTFAGTGMGTNNRVENIGLWSYYPNRGNWNRE